MRAGASRGQEAGPPGDAAAPAAPRAGAGASLGSGPGAPAAQQQQQRQRQRQRQSPLQQQQQQRQQPQAPQQRPMGQQQSLQQSLQQQQQQQRRPEQQQQEPGFAAQSYVHSLMQAMGLPIRTQQQQQQQQQAQSGLWPAQGMHNSGVGPGTSTSQMPLPSSVLQQVRQFLPAGLDPSVSSAYHDSLLLQLQKQQEELHKQQEQLQKHQEQQLQLQLQQYANQSNFYANPQSQSAPQSRPDISLNELQQRILSQFGGLNHLHLPQAASGPHQSQLGQFQSQQPPSRQSHGRIPHYNAPLQQGHNVGMQAQYARSGTNTNASTVPSSSSSSCSSSSPSKKPRQSTPNKSSASQSPPAKKPPQPIQIQKQPMSAPQAPKGNGSAHKPGPAGDINVNTATPKNTTSLVPEGKSNARKEAQTQAKTSKPSKPKVTVAPTKIIPVTKGVDEKTSRAAANPVAPQGGNVPLAAGGSSFVKPEAPIPLQAPKEDVLAPPPWRDGGARADVISPLPMNRVERFVERHRRWKNRYCWPDEEASEVLSYRDVHLNVDAVTTKQLCVCQLCKCKVGVTRFANHLETCSRRAARKRGRTSAAQGSVASVGSTSVLAQASQGDLSSMGGGESGRLTPSLARSRSSSSAAATASALRKKRSPSTTGGGSANKKARAGTSASLGAAARAHASLAEANIKKKSLSLAREASKKLPAPVFLDESFRCRACNLRGNVDDSTILCDGCDRGYHIRCIHRLGLNVDKLARDDGKETVDELRDRLTSIAEPYFCVECLPKLGEEHRGTVNSPTLGMSTSEKVKHGRIYAETGPIEFICDSCQKQISKSRWRCLVCNNFDACNNCHQNFVRHANNPKASFEASMSSSLNSESPSGTKPCVHHGTHRAQRIAL